MPEDMEMSLSQFIRSTWFKGLARLAVFFLLPLAGYAAGQFFSIDSRLDTIEADTAQRIIRYDQQWIRANDALSTLRHQMIDVSADITQMKVAIGEIKGMLKSREENVKWIDPNAPPADPPDPALLPVTDIGFR